MDEGRHLLQLFHRVEHISLSIVLGHFHPRDLDLRHVKNGTTSETIANLETKNPINSSPLYQPHLLVRYNFSKGNFNLELRLNVTFKTTTATHSIITC